MAFQSINELEKFSYDDCVITNIKLGKNDNDKNYLELTLEALIVKGNNSQNSNYTDSYADETKMVFEGVDINSAVIEGYKCYGADNSLISETQDEIIEQSKVPALIGSLKDAFLFSAQCVSKSEDKMTYIIEVDTGELESTGLTDPYSPTYEINLSFDRVIVSWERYMNRVQK